MEELILTPKTELFAHVQEEGEDYVIPPLHQPTHLNGDTLLWILDGAEAHCLRTTGLYHIRRGDQTHLLFDAPYTAEKFSCPPRCDFLGNRFRIRIGSSDQLEKAMAHFYWQNLLNQCAERTLMRRKHRLREGYILSTLKTDFYAGTYPAVDHEFHIRGRMAMGDAFDVQVVRRMIERQLHLMRTDWRRLFRVPCSLQPNGHREYRVTRRSQDRSVKAVMFPLTGVIELIEAVYHYYCRTKDIAFVQNNLETLEGGAAWIQRHLDANGCLWSDVYYEDQVMKDGATAQAQAFAIHSLRLMAQLETLSGRPDHARSYGEMADRMAAHYIRPIPHGYWDPSHTRYVDWIDRRGAVHDHIHLLSNALSVTYGLNPAGRDHLVNRTIHSHDDIFQKFPSFVAARIEDYTPSEIGSGGPYDLCAAGRYWCHDAKYRKALGEAGTILNQLTRVAAAAEQEHYYMGERYDMNYIYYNTGEAGTQNWHGSPRYYEYPNVFLDVLVHDFLGVGFDEEADLSLSPCCTAGTEMAMDSIGISYRFTGGNWTVTNTSPRGLRLRVDLRGIFNEWVKKSDGGELFSLPPNGKLSFSGTPRIHEASC